MKDVITIDDILKRIDDPKLYISVQHKNSGVNLEFFSVNIPRLVNSDVIKEKVTKINVQHTDNKRILLLEVE